MPLDGANNYTGRNFTPIAPLKDARRTVMGKNDPSSHTAFFRELYEGLSTENDEGWRECIEQARVISLMRSGKYVIKRDLASQGFVYFKRVPTQDRSNYPLFPQNSEILTAKWAKIRPLVQARSFGDGYKAELQRDLVDTFVKSKFRDIFTTDYETREAYSAQDYGTYITQFEYDQGLNPYIQIVPIIQQQSKVLVDGYGACYDCMYEGKPADFEQSEAAYPQCPQCGSFRTSEMVPDQVADESFVADIDTIKQGDIRGHLRDWGASRYDARVFPHESPWFIYSERMPLRLITQLFGELEIDTDAASEYAFEVMDALSMRGGSTEGNINGRDGSDDLFGTYTRFTEEGTLRSMWLKPEMYAGFKLREAEDTVSGRIPADVPYEELFPKGICVRGFNDMNLQVGFYAEKANIASNVYLYQSSSGVGKGIDSAVDTAKDLNEVYSMAMATLKRYGASGLAINKDAGVTQEDVRNLFKPQGAVFVDTSQIGGDINKAITQMQVNPINPALPQMMIQLANMVNLAFMTGDFAQGATNDVDINTFGGQQLAHAKAEEQKAGIFSRKVAHRVISAEVICELYREYGKIPRYFTAENDSQSQTRGKLISGADLPDVIQFDAVPESEVPENKFEKRMAKQEMVEKAGGFANLAQAAQAFPHLTAWYTEGYGVNLPTLDQNQIKTVCYARLVNIKEMAEMIPDPEAILGYLEKPLNVRETSHLLKAEFLQEVLDDDEVATWNPVAKAAVELLIETHYQLDAEAQVRNERIKMQAANQLMAEQQQFQQQMMQPQIDAENAAMEEQALMGAVAEVGGRVLGDEQKQVDADREEETRQRDHARALELASVQAALKPAPERAATR